MPDECAVQYPTKEVMTEEELKRKDPFKYLLKKEYSGFDKATSGVLRSLSCIVQLLSRKVAP